MKKYWLTLACFLLYFQAWSQDEHPIEKQANSKLDDAMTTADMMAVQGEAYQSWDHLLSLVYGELKNIMRPATFAAFEKSQEAWQAYRDAEFNAISQLYYAELQGTMWRPVAVYARKEVLKKRTDDLMELYWLLTGQSEEDPLTMMGKWQVTSGDLTGTVLELGDDFTARWKTSLNDEASLEFYMISDLCQGEKQQDGKSFVTFAKAGKPDEQRCYKLQLVNDTRLELVATSDSKLITLNRIN